MALTETRGNIYDKCAPIARTKPNYQVDEQLSKEMATGYRLLPEFERTLYEDQYTRLNSLQRNHLLKCRWAQYKDNIQARVFAPFQFPNIRDLHFYNCAVRIKPEASVYLTDHRMKMKPGVGVDSRGHLPIPQEAMMKRGTTDKHNKQTEANVKKQRKASK